MSLSNLFKVTTSCKISDDFNGWSRRKTWTNERTDKQASKHKPPSDKSGDQQARTIRDLCDIVVHNTANIEDIVEMDYVTIKDG